MIINIIRILLGVALLVLMWMGNKYALYFIITLTAIGQECAGFLIKKIYSQEKPH